MAKLHSADLSSWLGLDGSEMLDDLLERFTEADLSYSDLVPDEHDATVLQTLLELDRDQFARSGPERQCVWELAWGERLRAYEQEGDVHQLTPVYFTANPLLRLKGRYVRPSRPSVQSEFSALFREGLFRKHLASVDHVFEFGAGSGFNLMQLRSLFPRHRLTGLDWSEAAVELLQSLGQRGHGIDGTRFDFFHPASELALPKDCAVLTMCALEQIGTDYQPFLDYLLVNRPALVLHMEPIFELYRSDCLLDYLAQRYHLQRNYLRGYLPALQDLVRQGRIELLQCHRVPFGNQYHDGYSTVIWRPCESN